jgi:ankyrin repeat protein
MYTYTADSLESKKSLFSTFEDTILGFHFRSKANADPGWIHNITLGTYYSAALRGDIIQLQKHLNYMVSRGISLDNFDELGMSALHWAAYSARELCVKELLLRGANPNILQAGGFTPLMLASCRGHENIVRLLLDKRADTSIRSKDGFDALGLALIFGHTAKGFVATIEVLIKKGMDPCVLDEIHSSTSQLHIVFQMEFAF